jgi:hypothetical protein
MKRFASVQIANLLALCAFLLLSTFAQAQTDPLPSWNDGAAKKAIIEFVHATTDTSSKSFVRPEARIATFDQDGTLWNEYPMVPQVIYSLDRVPAVVKVKPELANVEPFKTVMSGNREAMAKLTIPNLIKIASATLTGMSVDDFNAQVKEWLATAKHPRWKRPYTELTYLPMREVLKCLRANGYKTYIVTGGGRTSYACSRKRPTASRRSRWWAPWAEHITATTRTAGRCSQRNPSFC